MATRELGVINPVFDCVPAVVSVEPGASYAVAADSEAKTANFDLDRALHPLEARMVWTSFRFISVDPNIFQQ
jgi:hypothetical protein